MLTEAQRKTSKLIFKFNEVLFHRSQVQNGIDKIP